MSCPKCWLIIGCVLAALSVVFGAFGAHGLDGLLVDLYGQSKAKVVAGFEMPASYKYLQDFKTAADYQMYHALGLIALGLIAQGRPRTSDKIAAWCFLMGIVFFSGSLYFLVLTGKTWLGAIAPIGGTLMIVAWIALAVSCKRLSQTGEPDAPS